MNRVKLLVICCVFIFSACQSKKTFDYKIQIEEAIGNERIIPLSEIGKTIEYIQLETNDSSLVGNIKPLFYNNYFYVIDTRAQICKIFDSKGNYIGNLGRKGRGPGEYTRIGINSLSFDEKSGNVFLYTDGKIIEYSSSGKYIREIIVPNEPDYFFNIYKILRFENNFAVAIGNMKGNNDLIFLNDTGNYINEIPRHYSASMIDKQSSLPGSSITPQVLALPANISMVNQELRFSKPDNDTVFSVNKSFQKSVAYILDFGRYKTPESCTSLSERMNYIQVQDMKTVETQKYIFFSFMLGKNAPQGIVPPVVKGMYDKQTKTLQLLKRPGADKEEGFLNDIDNQNAFWPQSGSKDGYLLMAIYHDNGQNPCIMRVKTHG